MPDGDVIVTGGSVTVKYSDKFTDEPNSNGKKVRKKADAKLKALLVNGVKVQDLAETDEVKVTYWEP
ncbi:MAG: hypothetical protein ABR577_03105 [Pyrinomonadaceae bacterium]